MQVAKAGGAYANAVGTYTNNAGTYLQYTLAAGDTGTVGDLAFRVALTAGGFFTENHQVVAFDPADPNRLGLAFIPGATPNALGGMLTVGTGAGQISPSGGKVDLIAAAITAILSGTALPEGYPADGATGTLAQLLYLLLANMGQADLAGASLVVRKLDGTTPAATYLLNDPAFPTSRTRTA